MADEELQIAVSNMGKLMAGSGITTAEAMKGFAVLRF